MISSERSTGDNFTKDFQDLIDLAKRENIDAFEQVEAYTSAQAELESFRAYLDIMNEPPTVVTANRAT